MDKIIITGNPVNGFTYYGTFSSVDEATDWAGLNLGGDWWVAELNKPEATKESLHLHPEIYLSDSGVFSV